MDDLKSRQVATKTVEDLPNCYNGYSNAYDKAHVIGVLEELPTAEKIVKCNECKHWDTEWIPAIGEGHYCPMIDNVMLSDEWCCYGEREKDD